MRFSIDPLLALVPGETNREVARHLGISPDRIASYRRRGLSWRKADELAVRCLGRHPRCVWAEWDDLIEWDDDDH